MTWTDGQNYNSEIEVPVAKGFGKAKQLNVLNYKEMKASYYEGNKTFTVKEKELITPDIS